MTTYFCLFNKEESDLASLSALFLLFHVIEFLPQLYVVCTRDNFVFSEYVGKLCIWLDMTHCEQDPPDSEGNYSYSSHPSLLMERKLQAKHFAPVRNNVEEQFYLE